MASLTYAYVWFGLEQLGQHDVLMTTWVISALVAPYAGSLIVAGRGARLRLLGAAVGVLAVSAALWVSLALVLHGGTAACGADDCGIGFAIVAQYLLWIGLALVVPALLAVLRSRRVPS